MVSGALGTDSRATFFLTPYIFQDSTTHSSSYSASPGNTATHANISLSQSSSNGTTAGHSSPSTWTPNGTGNSSLQSQGNGVVGNTGPNLLTPTTNSPLFQSTSSTDYGLSNNSEVQNNSNMSYANSPPAYMPTDTGPTILTPTSNSPSIQSTVSTNYGSYNNFEVQDNGNISYANNPPVYMPTSTEDPSAAITSSMASLMNSNDSVNNDNSQYQYSNTLIPPATSYTVTDNSALTSSYYEVPQESFVQTENVQIVDVSSNGTSGFIDYSTVQSQTADCSQDVSVTTEYGEDTTITDVTTTEFEYSDSSAGLF